MLIIHSDPGHFFNILKIRPSRRINTNGNYPKKELKSMTLFQWLSFNQLNQVMQKKLEMEYK
jgi:hypothetical protein